MTNVIIAAAAASLGLVQLTSATVQTNNGVAFDGATIVMTGAAEAVDGDTLWLGIHKIRLNGIDALESKQTCEKDGAQVRCGERAYDAFKGLISSGPIRCVVHRGNFGKPVMDSNRYLATCYENNRDIGREMVAAGWAVAANGAYRDAESLAKASKLGLHALNHMAPKAWRKLHKADEDCDKPERVLL